MKKITTLFILFFSFFSISAQVNDDNFDALSSSLRGLDYTVNGIRYQQISPNTISQILTLPENNLFLISATPTDKGLLFNADNDGGLTGANIGTFDYRFGSSDGSEFNILSMKADMSAKNQAHGYRFTATITGYRNGTAVATDNIDFGTSDSDGSVTYQKNAHALAKGGSLTFSAAWQNIDEIRFTGGEAGTISLLMIDDLDFSEAQAPTVTTTPASSVASTTVTLAGNATADGGAAITERGYVYAITAYNSTPQISGTGVFKVTDGTGTGTFTENITDLVAATQYSYRAYATNSQGTSYGSVLTFNTPAPTSFPHTITFNLGLTDTYKSLGRSTTVGQFTFAINSPDTNDNIIVDHGVNIAGTGSYSLSDDNLDANQITKWTISKTDGTEFKLVSLLLKDSGVGGSTSGTIKAFRDGAQIGATVNINFDGLKNLNANTDFQNIDEIQIEAVDINIFIDDFTFAAPIIADTTAPVFENSTPSSSAIAQTSFTLGTDIDEAGTIYYVVVADGATAPTATEVKAGTGNGGSGQLASGNQAVSTGGFTHNFNISSLTAGTAYDVYVVAQDDEGTPNLQTSVTKIDVTTSNAISLTVTGLTGDNKVYDGTTAATASGTATLSGVIGADDVSLGGSPVYTFANANVGTGITMGTTGFTISGADAGKYTLTQPTLSANITAATLTVVGLTGDNKVYDGTTAATASGTATLSGVIGADDVSLGGSPVYTFANANVGTGITINSSGFTISGTASGNYSLTQPTLSADITAATLTVVGLTGNNKVYDGTTAATGSGTATLSGVIGADDVSLGGSPVYTFANANVGTGITINSSGFTISGTASGNYSLTQPTLSADITAATLTVVGLTGDNKVYDGTTAATASGTATLSGVIGADDVSLGGSPVYTFASANVGTGITMGTTGFTISGTDSGNYSLTQPTLSGDITAATLTVVGLTGNNKVYDGTTAGTASGTATLSGVIGADDVSLGGSPVYTFASANIGTGITMGTTGFTISGTDSGNYSLTQPTLSADITAVTPTITFNNINKTYGDTNFNLAASSNSSGAITYSIIGTANGTSISGANVTLGNVGSVTIRASQAANGIYSATTQDITLSIAQRNITVTADSGQAKTSGSADPAAYTYQITSGSLVGSDSFSGALTREAGELTGNYNILIGTLTLGSNYNLSFVGSTFTIDVVVTTGHISRSSKSVIVTGQVASGVGIIERGVVYSSVDTTPELGEANVIKVVDDTTTGPFVVEIYGLNPTTTYYYRSYIITTVAKSTSTPTIYGGVKSFVTLATEPNLVSKSPVNSTLKVAPDTNLTLNFDTNVQKGTGNILIKKSADNSIVASIDVTSANVTVAASTVTINPTADLPEKTQLYIEVPIGAFEDTSNNSWTGFGASTDWTFTTDDITAPTITSFAPTDNAIDVAPGANFVATFNEDVKKGTGNLLVKKVADDSTVGSLDVTSAMVSIAGNVVTINPPVDMPSETELYIEVPATAFLDLYDNAFAGFTGKTTWNFTTADITPPTVNITSTSANYTNTPFTVTFTFSEDVKNFDLGDLTLVNATAGVFNKVNNSTYTALITPTTENTVSVNILADKVQDDSNSNNGNIASNVFSITYDVTKPTLAITTNTTNPTNVTSFVATFTFSEDMDDFDTSYFTVSNGTASNFVSISDAVYTAVITPAADGNLTINVAEDETEDHAGNGNTAASYTTLVDTVKPTVAITSSVSNPTNAPFTATITFSEDVLNFEMADITLANATASNFTATSASVYTALITPTADGNVTIDVAAGVANDAATNTNTAATQFTVLHDATKPTVAITSTASNPTNAPFTATVTFSEDVSNFEMADITVANATVSNFVATSASVYTALITPTADGNVTIDVAADVANDAATNTNTAATQFSILYDTVKPTVAITSTVSNPTNAPFTATITFSEDVLNFEMADITLTNATASNFVATSASVYTALITPTADGTVSINIAADVANDAATNTNTAATQLSTLYDATKPNAPVIVGIDTYSCAGVTTTTADNTLVFNGTAEANSTVELFINASSVGTTTADASGNWTYDHSSVTLADGTYNARATATDAATNTSDDSSTFSIIIDTKDFDGDGNPDFCDTDDDNDGVLDVDDNSYLPNPDQEDSNNNGIGDVQEDCDNDGILNYYDTDNASCQASIVMKKKYGFSPNGDGVNDTWVIENIALYPNNVVNIYNRSGKLVFSMKGYDNSFNGFSNKTSSSNKLPVGAYYFTVEFNTPGAKPAKGWIYINY